MVMINVEMKSQDEPISFHRNYVNNELKLRKIFRKLTLITTNVALGGAQSVFNIAEPKKKIK
ncbi:hypothetical protein BLOT_003488 [Blomia tropicalis]|nr:hypothetical protein BLOT_003488 [Blomia tropicalis]